jgi:sugar lactone lactonase YvrE
MKVPHGIVLDGRGGLFIADIGNNRIRRVDLESGVIETFAGTGQPGIVRVGARADESPLPGPRALAARDDALWVVLREGHSVWRIDLKTRVLLHIGGTGKAGYTGDGGPAREATFNGPKGLAVDASARLYIVDSENDCVRVLDTSTGRVETIAGRGKSRRFSGDDGPARQAELSQPHGICVDREGTVYVGDTLNHRVRQIRRKP